MKHLQLITLLSFITLLLACSPAGEDKTETTNTGVTKEKEKEIVVTEYQLLPEESKAIWQRTLDQKPTQQNVNFLGKKVKLNLGDVTMTSNGSVTITSGQMTTMDDSITAINIVFDMNSFQLAKEKGNGLFDVKKHPNSTLELENITKDANGYTADGTLQIEEVAKPVKVQILSIENDSTMLINGNFKINTLDYPLRHHVTAKDVNIDEINVDFKLSFKK